MSRPPSKKPLLDRLFRGQLEGWLPLFRRLLARLSLLPSTEVVAGPTAFQLRRTDASRKRVGSVRVRKEGLLLGLCLPTEVPIRSPRLSALTRKTSEGITHTVLITRAAEIDSELLNWIRVARARARTSKRRST